MIWPIVSSRFVCIYSAFICIKHIKQLTLNYSTKFFQLISPYRPCAAYSAAFICIFRSFGCTKSTHANTQSTFILADDDILLPVPLHVCACVFASYNNALGKNDNYCVVGGPHNTTNIIIIWLIIHRSHTLTVSSICSPPHRPPLTQALSASLVTYSHSLKSGKFKRAHTTL